MSDPGGGKGGVSWQRVALWVGVAAVALWMIITGISGIIAKGG